jgi:anti-anti-sigma factor
VTSTWGLDRTEEGISVRGEIDLASADDLVEAVCESARDAPRPFVIDLSAVTFMDSAGVNALTRVANVLTSSDIVIRPSREVFRVLDLVGLTNGSWKNVVVLPPPDDLSNPYGRWSDWST